MRAAVIHTQGEPPRIDDVPEPEPGTGQALVELGAAGVNPIDIAIGSGRFYGGSPDLPYVAGREGIGRVVGGDGFLPGARVYTGRAEPGSLAERFVVDADSYELPEGDDDELAVALGIAGLAGWLAVAYQAQVRPGDSVLVLGATGTVGHVAIQAARLEGASRVVAAGRNAARLQRASELGADATVTIDDGDLATAIRDAFDGDGPDVVIDPLWGPPLAAAIEAAARFARVVNLGQSAGADATLRSGAVRGKGLRVLGHSNYDVPRDVRRDAHARMLAHARAGELHVQIEPYPLERAAEAWQAQVAGPAAKLVVTR
jgi:NADPH2:quinone reductase